jgi:hypothetical protein
VTPTLPYILFVLGFVLLIKGAGFLCTFILKYVYDEEKDIGHVGGSYSFGSICQTCFLSGCLWRTIGVSKRKVKMTKYRSFYGIMNAAMYCVYFLILTMLTNCAEVPVTQRRGLHLVPNLELNTMSLQEYDKVIKESKLSTDNTKIQMVRKTGERIAKAAEAFLVDTGQGHKVKNYQWEFNLIEDDKTANAWCMPGGKVAVYTGILPFTMVR